VSGWFSGYAWAIVVACVLGGVAMMGSIASRNWGFKVGCGLVYVPVCYLTGGVFGIFAGWSQVTSAVLIGILAVLAHRLVLMQIEIRDLKAVGSVATTEMPALGPLSSGITHVYARDESMRVMLDADLSGVPAVRIVAAGTKELLTGTDVISEVLRRCSASGTLIRVLNDGELANIGRVPLSGGPKKLEVVGRDRVDGSGSWQIIATPSVAYFSLRPPGSVNKSDYMCRVQAGGVGAPSLGDSVLGMVDAFFRWGEQDQIYAPVKTSSSPLQYSEVILPAESGASRIERLPKRLSIVFKGPDTVKSIAEGRFGYGSSSVDHYIAEHSQRRVEFFAALARGMRCREIYNRNELIEYISSRRHGTVILSKAEIIDTLNRWRHAVAHEPYYFVAVSDDPLPFKYELVDGRLTILQRGSLYKRLPPLEWLVHRGLPRGGPFLERL
jgi:hypothetical protein